VGCDATAAAVHPPFNRRLRLQALVTTGTGSLANSIVEVFGVKFAHSLQPLFVVVPATGAAARDDGAVDGGEDGSRMRDEGDGMGEGGIKSPGVAAPLAATPVPSPVAPLVASTAAAAAAAAATTISGFVSKPGAGVGKATSERQFTFINGRPVDIPVVSAAVESAPTL
jgi:hypothetical protein